MHYVKHFKINGVDTKQVACIELQGKPNAATEGAVGVLGMDVTSPTHDVYKCVAVNGSIYTWELLSAGMSIICSTLTGSGALKKQFGYSTLLTPANYLLKVGDLILDSSGFLYQVSALNAEYCDTDFCKIKLGGAGNGQSYELQIDEGTLKLVTLNGEVVGIVDYVAADGATITRDPDSGEISARGVKTINDSMLSFFTGTQDECESLPNKDEVFPIVTDGTFPTGVLRATYIKAKPIVGTVDDGAKSVTVALKQNCVYVVMYGAYQAVLRVGAGKSVVRHLIPSFGTDGALSGVEEAYMQYDYTNERFTRYGSNFTPIYFSEAPKFLKIAEFDI